MIVYNRKLTAHTSRTRHPLLFADDAREAGRYTLCEGFFCHLEVDMLASSMPLSQPSSLDELRAAAMLQPLEIRARLAHELLMSLDAVPGDDDADAAWSEVVDARAARVQSGSFVARDWEQSLAGIKVRLDGRG